MGLSALFPVFHGLELYGFEEMRDKMGLSWLVLQGFLYILGAGLYAVSMPSNSAERVSNIRLGSMAREVMARLLRHMGQFPSDFSCLSSHGSRITLVWFTGCVRLSTFRSRAEMLDTEEKTEEKM